MCACRMTCDAVFMQAVQNQREEKLLGGCNAAFNQHGVRVPMSTMDDDNVKVAF
jgi:hypothetical protein